VAIKRRREISKNEQVGCLFSFWGFETKSLCVAQAGLEFMTFLPQPPEC
jgi:hypothetical protein